MAGYSKRSLAAKLGIKSGTKAAFINPPDGFRDIVKPLPEDVLWLEELEGNMDYVHLFSTDALEVEAMLPRLKAALSPNGMLWVSWPKKASKVATDLSGNVVRRLGLAVGLVDIKVCAVDDIWSGLKFVFRLKDR